MKVFILILFLIAIPKAGESAWTQEKTARELVFLATIYNDWRQTLVIAKTPWRGEKNKILGSRPHRDNVNIYFGGCVAGHALITYALPDNYAKIWQDTWIGIESRVSDSNISKGHSSWGSVEYRLAQTVYF